MANPTTNFGWVLPTSTDLVTDLPADFEIALQGVDTSLVDLKGGTTGQLLKKASNTDMDFTWGIDPTSDLVTTAGDTIYATAADTLARLGIGTAGQVLTVNSGATAPEWKTPAGGGKVLQVIEGTRNTPTVINGAFADINLSASITPASASNKILIMAKCPVYIGANNAATMNGNLRLVRGASTVLFTDYWYVNSLTTLTHFMAPIYLDSPATTSSTTYKFQADFTGAGTSAQWFDNGIGRIYLLEIGA